MDFCRLGRWRGSGTAISARCHQNGGGYGGGRPAATPSSFFYLNSPSTPHRRYDHDQSSTSYAEQAYLIPKHRRRRRQRLTDMPGPGSAYQETLLGGTDQDWARSNKSYRITISNRELKWEHLQEYLGLEFEGLKVPKEQTKTLNEKFVLTLPVKLSAKQLQDIDLLRGDDADARAFLDDLKKEKLETIGE